jgi:4-amino-4-deoxy-L-arabinose transferase-like glycosyltransferase
MNAPPVFRASDKRAVTALFFVGALILRVLFLTEARDLEFFRVLGLDAQFYHDWATRIASGRAPAGEPFFQGPLYPYFLALFYRAFGSNVAVAQWTQMVLGSASAALTFLVGWKVFGRAAGIVAGILIAVYGYPMFLEIHLVTAPLLLLLLLVMVLLLLSAVETGAGWRFLATGVVLGLLATGRGLYLLSFAVAVVILAVALHGEVRRRALRSSALVGLGAALAILPVTVRNATRGGELVLLTTNGGINYYIGNHEGATGAFDKIAGVEFFQPATGPDGGSRALASRRSGRELTAGEASRYWLRQGLGWNLHHPLPTLLLWGKKLVLALSDTEIPQIENYGWARGESIFLQLDPVRFGWLAAFAIVGMVVSWRRNRLEAVLLLVVVSYLASLLPFFITGRFRVVLAPLLAVFAARALVFVVDAVRAGRRRAAVLSAAGGVALSVVLNLYTPPGIEAASDLLRFYNRGITAMQAGDFREAAQQFRLAARRDPQHVPTLANLAFCLTQLGQPADAVPLYRAALDIEPQATHLRRFLVEALLASNQLEDARTELKHMLDVDPQDTWARQTLDRLTGP